MRVSCDVILDLLPLYQDGVCSEASRGLVEEHLAQCETCSRALAEMRAEEGAPSDRGEAEELRGVAGTWKRSKLRSFLKGAFLVACAAFVSCVVAFEAIGSYVADDGTLVEPFYLIPIGYLFALVAAILGVCLLVSRRRR